MNKFEIPQVEVISFATEDIITTSNTTPETPDLPPVGGLVGDCIG